MPITTATQAHVDDGLARAVGHLILSLDAPPAAFQSLRDAICDSYGYRNTIDGESNPETKAQFSIRWIKETLRNVEKAYRVRNAGAAAEDAEQQTADVDVG